MRILLPTQTRFVTPGSTELHFYSDRHVRDRVRLHLRRVTENNNTERRTRETTTAKNPLFREDPNGAGKGRKVTEKAEGHSKSRRLSRNLRDLPLHFSEHARLDAPMTSPHNKIMIMIKSINLVLTIWSTFCVFGLFLPFKRELKCLHYWLFAHFRADSNNQTRNNSVSTKYINKYKMNNLLFFRPQNIIASWHKH